MGLVASFRPNEVEVLERNETVGVLSRHGSCEMVVGKLVRGPDNVASNSPLLRLHFDCFGWVSMRVGFVPIDRSNRQESMNLSTVSQAPVPQPLRSNKGRDAEWKQRITETPTC